MIYKYIKWPKRSYPRKNKRGTGANAGANTYIITKNDTDPWRVGNVIILKVSVSYKATLCGHGCSLYDIYEPYAVTIRYADYGDIYNISHNLNDHMANPCIDLICDHPRYSYLFK
jgi:hypothetical protein